MASGSGAVTTPAPASSTSFAMATPSPNTHGSPANNASTAAMPKFSEKDGRTNTSAAAKAAALRGPSTWPSQTTCWAMPSDRASSLRHRHVRSWSVAGDHQASLRPPMLKLCECAQQSLNVLLRVKAGEEKQPLAAFESGEVTKQSLAISRRLLLDPEWNDDAAQRYSKGGRFVPLSLARKMRGRRSAKNWALDEGKRQAL